MKKYEALKILLPVILTFIFWYIGIFAPSTSAVPLIIIFLPLLIKKKAYYWIASLYVSFVILYVILTYCFYNEYQSYRAARLQSEINIFEQRIKDKTK